MVCINSILVYDINCTHDVNMNACAPTSAFREESQNVSLKTIIWSWQEHNRFLLSLTCWTSFGYKALNVIFGKIPVPKKYEEWKKMKNGLKEEMLGIKENGNEKKKESRNLN